MRVANLCCHQEGVTKLSWSGIETSWIRLYEVRPRSVKGQVWWSRQFSKHDTTTLGDIQIRAKFYCPIKNEYFLDRHRPSFQAVLDCYQTGLLRRPDEIPLDVMINELKFYRLDETAIEDFLKSECILKSGFIRILALHRCRWQLLQATCGSDKLTDRHWQKDRNTNLKFPTERWHRFWARWFVMGHPVQRRRYRAVWNFEPCKAKFFAV